MLSGSLFEESMEFEASAELSKEKAQKSENATASSSSEQPENAAASSSSDRRPSPDADQQDAEAELTPLDRLHRMVGGSRSCSKGRSNSRNGSRSGSRSGSPRKRGSSSPWADGRLIKNPSFRSSSSSSRDVASKEKIHCVLILDWDDTLFPTTWIRDDCGFDWRKPLDEQLERFSKRGKTIRTLLSRFAKRACALLREASKQHRVMIVTLARRGWVHKSIERFCPSLSEVMEESKPKIIYAQEYASVSKRNQVPMGAEEGLEFWTEVKASAIRKELLSEGIPWTDIVSFGDSQYERAGTQRVVSELMKQAEANGHDGVSKPRMYSKTLKSLNCPTVEEVTAQLSLLQCWLPYIMDRDGDLDIEIDDAEDDVLITLDELIRGKVCSCGITLPKDAIVCPQCSMRRPTSPTGPGGIEEPLSWFKLAEMGEPLGAGTVAQEDRQKSSEGEGRPDDIGDQLFEMVSSMSSALSAGA